MLTFRYTCSRHQQMFIEAAKRGGCFDAEKLDEVRRKTRVWLSAKFPRAVLDHSNGRSCLGCLLEATYGDISEIERVIADLAQALAHS